MNGLKTLEESLSTALNEDAQASKKFGVTEPNFIVWVEADPEHIADSKKFGGVFSKFINVEKIKGLGIETGRICITKDTADEVSDMLDRETIKIREIWQVSKDFEYEDFKDGYNKYVKKSITSKREAQAYLRMLAGR